MILSSPLVNGSFDLTLPITAYVALFQGAFGSVDAWVKTLVNAAPLILAGFAVGIGFKAGLFNIGGYGQFLVGALGATAVALALNDASPIVAIPLSLLAGMGAGLLWGMIPGILKAFSGAHEVVTTIMLNYVAVFLVSYVIGGPLRGENVTYARTDDIVAAPAARSSSATLGTSGSCSPRPRCPSCGGSCSARPSVSRSAPPAPTAKRPATPG